jgi:hypothetical protein
MIFGRCTTASLAIVVATTSATDFGSSCPSSDPTAMIEHEGKYQENYRPSEEGVAVSIKISGEETCKSNNITQIEYNHEISKPGYNGNYVDISYVNCETNDCPSRRAGFWYMIGNHPDDSGSVPPRFQMDEFQNCPIWSCRGLQADATDDCLNKAYVKYDDDFATRFCDLEANWEVYLCDPAGPDGSSSLEPSITKEQGDA